MVWTGCNSGDATAPLGGPIAGTPTVGAPAAPAGPAALVVDRITAPDTLRPGAVLVIEGRGFDASPLANAVAIVGSDDVTTATAATNGAPSQTAPLAHAHVVVASPTRLDVRLPGADAFPCLPTGEHTLRITSGERTVTRRVTVQVARRIALAAGESQNLLDPSSAWCTELVGGGTEARYAVAVLNTSHSASSAVGVQVRAAQPEPMGHALEGLDHGATDPHGAHLDRERTRALGAGSATARWSAERARRDAGGRAGAQAAAVVAPLAEGQLVQRSAMYASCNASARITARVVYAGQRAVVLEDIASPRAGSMDAELRAMGREFDDVMYPLLAQQVGDPLALDAAMRGTGRVTMLFTRFVNDSAPNTTGYVTACNLYPRSTYAHSNEEALFYARVPAAGETVSAWRRGMRSTVMHEAKHLASFAERLSRDVPFEEPWLEEATARIAEELYARTFAGGGEWRGNTAWAGSLQCEVYQCDDRPLTMWKHFPVLHDYFVGVESLTPLGGATSGDVTWYASGWSLVRWAVDHYAADEGAFVRDLVRGGRDAHGTVGTGLAVLSARTGRSANELLAEWSLANLLDDRPGFTPARSTLTFPSWNLPSMMAGLSAMNGSRYRAAPLPVRDITGAREVAVPPLRGFAASYLEASVPAGAAQLVELRGANGGAVPSAIRLAVVRVQ